jgi:hypothetical protein
MAVPTVAVLRDVCNTSTGNQTFTTTDLGGLTPKAALFILGGSVTGGTAANTAMFGVGAATSATERWAWSVVSEHGQATSDVAASTSNTTRCLVILDGTGAQTNDGVADFDSFSANSVTVNWSNAPTSAYLITVVLFAGADLSAYAGSVGLGNTTNNAVDVTGPGFEPDVVIATGVLASTSAMEPSLGFVHNDRAGTITQRAVWFNDNEAATTACYLLTEDRGGIVDAVGTSGALDFYGEFSTFDASGFTVTTRSGGANSQNLFYLALKLDAATSAKVYTYTTPTSTGAASDTGAGFTPQAVLYITTLAEAAQTGYTDSLAGTFGLAVIDADDQSSTTISTEDNVADSNTQSLSTAQAFDVPLHDGSAGVQGTFSAFQASGVDYSYSTVTGTGKWWPALAFKTAAGASAAGPLIGGKLIGHGSLLGRLIH